MRFARAIVLGLIATLSANAPVRAEEGQAGQSEAPHQHADSPASPDERAGARWTLHLDGVLFGTFNRQGGRRGETEFRSQNWFMAMGSRPLGSGSFSATAMLTAEPFTVGSAGYSDVFQEGESYHGLQVTDRQHPHDLFMQLSAAWRVRVGDRTSVTIAGGPVGEAALGPVSFMHRASSVENPTPPLSHHIFDSTHLVHGVAMVRVDRGPIAVEASVFRGREPDEHRYDIELGALNSWSVRTWLTPWPEWTIQASHGFLKQPELLEPGNQRRTNASASWLRRRPTGFTAAMGAVGWLERPYSTVSSVLLEATERTGSTSLYGRFERTSVETEILLLPQVVHVPHPGELVDPIVAVTLGGIRDVARARRMTLGLGGDVTFYGVPSLLQITHDPHPISFRVFIRIARAGWDDRMLDTSMGGPSHSAPAHVH